MQLRIIQMKLLFVCIENACRSQMAEAFARMYGKDGVEVYSAGSRPSGKVNEKAIRAMTALGYDMQAHRSKSIREVGEQSFDYIITMGCGDECPFIPARYREDWDIPDPKDLDMPAFNRIRDQIGEKVRKLLNKALEI